MATILHTIAHARGLSATIAYLFYIMYCWDVSWLTFVSASFCTISTEQAFILMFDHLAMLMAVTRWSINECWYTFMFHSRCFCTVLPRFRPVWDVEFAHYEASFVSSSYDRTSCVWDATRSKPISVRNFSTCFQSFQYQDNLEYMHMLFFWFDFSLGLHRTHNGCKLWLLQSLW